MFYWNFQLVILKEINAQPKAFTTTAIGVFAVLTMPLPPAQ